MQNINTSAQDSPAAFPSHPVQAEDVQQGLGRLAGLAYQGPSQEDDLTEAILHLVAESLRVGLTFLSTVDTETQYITAVYDRLGMKLQEGTAVPLGDTYCTRMLSSAARSMVIEDARAHPYFGALAATHDLGIGAYSGVPLYYSDGRLYGTLCTLHPEARQEREGETALLALAGRVVMQAVEAREVANLRRQHQLILDHAGEGICGLDAGGRITFINPALEQMTGHESSGVLGRPWLDVFPPAAGRAGHPVAEALRSGLTVRATDTLPRRDGSVFPVELTCSPMLTSDTVTGAVITLQDITEREAVERAKDEFVSVVSHELRTPLTSIRGSLGLVAAGVLGPLPDDAQEMVNIAVSNTDRLVRLVNDILDIERIESGRTAMERTHTMSGPIVTGAVDVMRAMAQGAGVSLQVEAPDVLLYADADRITQVLTNLLSNAIKFSPPGGTVQVCGTLRDGVLYVQVSDQGRGIPANKLEAIFERFEQVDTSDSREKGGSGLGLPIARSIVEHHGGRLWATSEEGKGSVFTFTLPVADTYGATDSDSPVTRLAGDGTGLRILVVEDDPDLSKVLAGVFGGDNVSVYQARTVEEAVAASQTVSPDALILDLGLGEGNGFEVIDRLHHHPDYQHMPIVVYTARELSPPEGARLKWEQIRVVTKGRVALDDFERIVLDLIARKPGQEGA